MQQAMSGFIVLVELVLQLSYAFVWPRFLHVALEKLILLVATHEQMPPHGLAQCHRGSQSVFLPRLLPRGC